MMASIISEVLIVLLFVVPSATAWSTRSTHHQIQQQLQSRRSQQQHSTSCRLLLALSSSPQAAAAYDDFISREDWQALSQEDRNDINEKRRLTNPDSAATTTAAAATATATDVTIETTTTTASADAADGRYQGTVKWFNMVKGFGFVIRDDNKEDVFVHQTSIQSEGFRGLSLGAAVEFEIETTGDRTAAVNVTKPGGKKFKEASTTTTTATPPSSSGPSSLEAEIEVKDDAVANLISQSIF